MILLKGFLLPLKPVEKQKDVSCCRRANYEVDWAIDAICLGNVFVKMFPVVIKSITKLIGPLILSVWAMS